MQIRTAQDLIDVLKACGSKENQNLALNTLTPEQINQMFIELPEEYNSFFRGGYDKYMYFAKQAVRYIYMQ